MRKKKNRLFVYLIIVTALLFVGCGTKLDDVSQKMIDDINALGEITVEDEEQINKLIDRYATLTDVQKKAINNYATLLDAQDTIDEIKKNQIAEESAKKEALLEQESIQAVLAVIRELKDGLKHPDSLTVNSISYMEGEIAGVNHKVILLLVDYEAANDIGGSIRHSDSIGVGGFSDGSCFFCNRDDGGLGDDAYTLYLSCHNAWLKCSKDNPGSVVSVDVDFIMENI